MLKKPMDVVHGVVEALMSCLCQRKTFIATNCGAILADKIKTHTAKSSETFVLG